VFVHGGTTLQDSTPVPSRGLNNEIAFLIFVFLSWGIEFDVCLTGLRSAVHLNGRQGVIRSQETTDRERCKVWLDDGAHISVKYPNIAHIRSGNYKRI
jgi:hypothetical protein